LESSPQQPDPLLNVKQKHLANFKKEKQKHIRKLLPVQHDDWVLLQEKSDVRSDVTMIKLNTYQPDVWRPMAVIGSQVRPTLPEIGARRPRRPICFWAASLLAFWMLLPLIINQLKVLRQKKGWK
jgi:hypothetical protein